MSQYDPREQGWTPPGPPAGQQLPQGQWAAPAGQYASPHPQPGGEGWASPSAPYGTPHSQPGGGNASAPPPAYYGQNAGAPAANPWDAAPVSAEALHAYRLQTSLDLAPARRSTGKLVIGIVLVVFGVLAVLGRMASAATGGRSGGPPGDIGYAIGTIMGFGIVILIPLALGIYLIATSKRAPRR